MADSEFEKITPADINLSGKASSREAVSETSTAPLGVEEIRRSDEEKKKQSRILGGIFFLLLALVGGVIFILPELISPPDSASVSSVVVLPPQANSAAPVNSVAPFEEAQKLRQREAAQNVLAEVLDLQESLDEKEVALWAEESINRVFELASIGDEAYQGQDFIAATSWVNRRFWMTTQHWQKNHSILRC